MISKEYLKLHGYKFLYDDYRYPEAIIDTRNNRIIYIALHRKIVLGSDGHLIEIDHESLDQDIRDYLQKLHNLRKGATRGGKWEIKRHLKHFKRLQKDTNNNLKDSRSILERQ